MRFPALAAVSGPTLGYLAIGCSGFVLLAAGPRLLGPSEYGLLAVAWTLANMIGIGLATPGEQAVSRATATHEPGGVARKVRYRLLLLTLGVTLLPASQWTGLDPVLSGSPVWSWAVVLASLGWALAAPARGTLAGRGEFAAYAWSLAAEAGTRTALVGMALLGLGPSDLLLALSLGLPLVISAGVAGLLDRGAGPGPSAQTASGAASDQFWYTAVAFSIQVALSLPAVVLQAESPETGAAGSFVTASVYMRIPITFVGGLLVVVLAQVARHHSAGRTGSAARVTGRALVATLGMGAVGTGVLLLVASPALQILYGSAPDISRSTLLLLGCSTVAAMLAGVSTQALFGCGQARPTAVIWAGVAVFVVITAPAVPGTATAMAMTVLAGQTVALLGTSLLLPKALHHRPVFSRRAHDGRALPPTGYENRRGA